MTDRKEYYHLFLTWEDSGDEWFYFQQVILFLPDWGRSVINTKNEANERIINFGLQPPWSLMPFMDVNASCCNCCRTNLNFFPVIKTWTNEVPETEKLFRMATCLNVHKQSEDGILETMIASDRRPGSGEGGIKDEDSEAVNNSFGRILVLGGQRKIYWR